MSARTADVFSDALLTQFQNQLEDVERPTPRDRIGRGKISPTTTHAAGPQVIANVEMKRQIKAIIADTAALLCSLVLPAVTPTMPTMNWATTIKAAP